MFATTYEFFMPCLSGLTARFVMQIISLLITLDCRSIISPVKNVKYVEVKKSYFAVKTVACNSVNLFKEKIPAHRFLAKRFIS